MPAPTAPATTPPGGTVTALRPHPPEPRAALEGLLGAPFTEGNEVGVLRNGEQTFPALLAAIEEATRTVDLMWFAWDRGAIGTRLAGALTDRARAGVRVRVLLDGYGAKHVDPALVARLRAAGGQVVFYRPVPSWRPTVWNLRTHRRVLVCDEEVAFTGGTGIADPWTGDGVHGQAWRDTSYRVRGPAVSGLRSGFALPWLQVQARDGEAVLGTEDRFPTLPADGDSAVQVLRTASTPGWNDAALAIAALLQTARSRVRIATPYARLPRWLCDLVCDTARRGVAVQLLVSGPHVARPVVHRQADRDMAPLLDAGVEIWRYLPSLLHAKIVTVDGAVAMGGTTNLDVRSLALNEQMDLVVADPAVVAILDGHFDEDFARSARVTAAGWEQRPRTHRALETVVDVTGRPLRGWGSLGLVARRPDR
ncbi:cardiolipin synthase B [Geodermatophilus sp. DF01-2]|uniref:phospholipase D-like domain-containing protein n=1 Tax=Geodermatophilus sp. DF01-2 TaxID=2559610 RepID=UPI0010745988|nr:phospholipase D-like domain-containing protein [Geodermatophilus sp. DF01_2]TFV57716.1 cardiolipin synthase B [Geodermatophilus sp. DF01_2]